MELAVMNRFVASCAETRELLSDYADRELQPHTRRRVLRHLLMCRRCRAVLRSLKATIARLNAIGPADPAPDARLTDSVIARIRSRHDDGGGS
jgi:anti-sigma factor RsiW